MMDVVACAKELDMNAKKEDGHCLDTTRGCAERPALDFRPGGNARMDQHLLTTYLYK